MVQKQKLLNDCNFMFLQHMTRVQSQLILHVRLTTLYRI